jgi:hypothetical protein
MPKTNLRHSELLHLADAILAIEQKLLNGGGDQTVPGRYVTPVGYVS